MKYLKLFEDIDWEEEWEEEDPDDSILKVGDIISPSNSMWWNSNKNEWINYIESPQKLGIEKIEHSSNIDRDVFTKFEKGSIPYDGYLVKFKGKWPWFKIENEINIK